MSAATKQGAPSVTEVADRLEAVLKQAQEFAGLSIQSDKAAEDAQNELRELLSSLAPKSDKSDAEIQRLKETALDLQKQVINAEEQLKSLRHATDELIRGFD